MRYLQFLATLFCLTSFTSVGVAAPFEWGNIVLSPNYAISNTRLCMGNLGVSRSYDIACPSYAPSITTTGDVSVTGNLSANQFIGDGSLLTGVGSGDRITSGTLAVIAISDTGYVSMTTDGTTWGYFSAVWSYLPSLFTNHVSATTISTSMAHFTPQAITNLIGGGGNMILSGTTAISTSSAGLISMAAGGTTIATVSSTGLHVVGNITCTGTCNGSGGAAAADSISSTGTTARVYATPGGTVSFTTGSTAGSSYLDTTGRWIGPGISITTWNGISSTNGYFSGRVGIGTSEPSTHLEISGSSGVAVRARVRNGNSSGAADFMLLNNTNQTSGIQYFGSSFPGSSAGLSYANMLRFVGVSPSSMLLVTDNASPIAFATNSSERMRIDASGNVGIGTTSPGQRLEIYGLGANFLLKSAAADIGDIIFQESDGNQKGRIWTHTDAGTSGEKLNFSSGDTAPDITIDSSGNVGIGVDTLPTVGNVKLTIAPVTGAGLGIGWNYQGGIGETDFINYGNGGVGGFSFYNYSSNGGSYPATAPTHLMTLTSTGNVGIGTTSPNDGKLEVKGGSVCVDTNSDDSATQCIANESDRRLKTNIRPLEGGLEKLTKLQGVRFSWRVSDAEVLKHYPLLSRFKTTPHAIGLIAQDVQKVVPEAIDAETVGDETVQYLQLDYAKLVPVMVEAIKELKAENDALAAKVQSLADAINAK